ncbi:MAG: DUF427 domain-containing protein [Pseudomonadota bacterium]
MPELDHIAHLHRNPDNPDHLMRLKMAGRRVRVVQGDTVLADSDAATRVMEVGRDFLDPVFYIPPDDLTAALTPIPGKTTFCPLKGDASYFAAPGGPADVAVAWTYAEPLPHAAALKGLVAFYADQVTVEEVGGKQG